MYESDTIIYFFPGYVRTSDKNVRDSSFRFEHANWSANIHENKFYCHVLVDEIVLIIRDEKKNRTQINHVCKMKVEKRREKV